MLNFPSAFQLKVLISSKATMCMAESEALESVHSALTIQGSRAPK